MQEYLSYYIAVNGQAVEIYQGGHNSDRETDLDKWFWSAPDFTGDGPFDTAEQAEKSARGEA